MPRVSQRIHPRQASARVLPSHARSRPCPPDPALVPRSPPSISPSVRVRPLPCMLPFLVPSTPFAPFGSWHAPASLLVTVGLTTSSISQMSSLPSMSIIHAGGRVSGVAGSGLLTSLILLCARAARLSCGVVFPFDGSCASDMFVPSLPSLGRPVSKGRSARRRRSMRFAKSTIAVRTARQASSPCAADASPCLEVASAMCP